MTNYEAKIKVKEDCKFHRFTAEHPDSRITYWCNEKNCVMVVESKDMDDIEDFQGMGFCCPDTKISRQGAHLEVMYEISQPDAPSINNIITSAGCWYLQPVTLHKGWEYFTVYSIHKPDLEKMIQNAKANGMQVELLSLRELGINDLGNGSLMPTSALHADITQKQLELLKLAYEEGYFDQPARITADKLAMMVGLSRSTLAEHLRKAEYKLLRNTLPALLLGKMES